MNVHYTNYFAYQSNDELWTVRLINMRNIAYSSTCKI